MYTDPWAHWELTTEYQPAGLDKAWKDTEGDVAGPSWKPINYGAPIIDKEKMLDSADLQKLSEADGNYVEQCVKAYAGNPNYATIHLRFNVQSSANIMLTVADQNDGLEIYAWNYNTNDWQKVYDRIYPSGFTTLRLSLGSEFVNNRKADLVLISEAKWKFGMIYDKACVAVDAAAVT